MSEKLYEVLQKVLRVSPNIDPFSLDWYSEVLTLIRDIILEDEEGLSAVEKAVEEWASWLEKNIDIGLKDNLWEIKKEIWRKRAEKYGWEYVSTAVVRDFVNELAKVVYDGNIGKMAEIFRLLELALEKNRRKTVELLIEYIDHYYGDIEALVAGLKEIVSGR
jgi:hypothetical protein